MGDPAVEVDSAPHCGCDACDHGSDQALEIVDEAVADVLNGSFRRLTRSGSELTMRRDGWASSGDFDSDAIRAALESSDHLPGWDEVAASTWFSSDQPG